MDISTIMEYIKPELLILIPVLYLFGIGIKSSQIRDKFIPLILGCVGILLSALYLYATVQLDDSAHVATLIFTAFTQGVLCAGASVYIDQLIKQAKKED